MSHKICPICSTPAHRNAQVCAACGASLRAVRAADVEDDSQAGPPEYDHHYGETDLSESSLNWKGGTYILGGMLTLAILVCIGGVFILGTRFFEAMTIARLGPAALTATSVKATEDHALSLITNTPRPTLFLPTVTPAPPTLPPTATPGPTDTPGPCMQEVQPGDSLIVIVGRCGHRDLAVIDLVLQINNLDAPEVIQIGQTLEIPWPTPTIDPNAQPAEETPEVGVDSSADTVAALADVSIDNTTMDDEELTPTLQPGVAWHRVSIGEDIISISIQYGANIKIMSELNPEVTFSQCDFGEFGGGAQCVVQIYEGQMLRVPAPTPLPTLSPTLSGSETPTPTATATFNAPSAISPSNRVLFQSDEIVTLRWVASGALTAGQTFRVHVEDITANEVYTGDTADLFFIIPQEWQGRDSRRHEYAWSVSVIDTANPDDPYFTTETRTFEWEARREGN